MSACINKHALAQTHNRYTLAFTRTIFFLPVAVCIPPSPSFPSCGEVAQPHPLSSCRALSRIPFFSCLLEALSNVFFFFCKPFRHQTATSYLLLKCCDTHPLNSNIIIYIYLCIFATLFFPSIK